jgi:hypothetical protein
MGEIVQTNITQIQKVTKYILMGLIVVFAIRYIPNISLKNEEIIMIGAISSIAYAILDMVAPTIRVRGEQKKKIIVEGTKQN